MRTFETPSASNAMPAVMPDGRLAPSVMTEAEFIRWLRLDELGVKNPKKTLDYYKAKGVLRPTHISNRCVYTREEGMEFLRSLTYSGKRGPKLTERSLR
jgi:hypothetical protein